MTEHTGAYQPKGDPKHLDKHIEIDGQKATSALLREFRENIGNECRAVAYRTAPWNGKLTQQGAAMLDVYGALQVLVKVIKDAIEIGTVGGNE